MKQILLSLILAANALGASQFINQGKLQSTMDLSEFSLTNGNHINFGATAGASGYGIRENAGELEFKNLNGAWVPIGAREATIGDANGTWAAGVTVLNQSPAITGSDKTTTLPLASGYVPGQTITFNDSLTTLNFGRTFSTQGGDTLIGATAPYRPFLGKGTVRFKAGVGTWTVLDTALSAYQFTKPDDLSAKVTVDLSDVPTNTTYTFKPAPSGNSVGIKPEAAIGSQFVTNAISNGTLASRVVAMTDIVPNQFNVSGDALASDGITAVTYPQVVTNTGEIDVIRLERAMTASRSYVFPSTANYSAGESVRFYDATGSVGLDLTATEIASGADTFNGNTSITFMEPFFNRVFVANPASTNWTVSAGGSLGLDTIHPITPVSGVATLPCLSNVIEQRHTVSMSAAVTLAFSGAQAGMTGKIKFLDSTGAHVVTVPNSSGYTPTTEGVGVFTTSTGTNIIDIWEWIFDGSKYDFYPLSKKGIAAAAPDWITDADTSAYALSTSGFTSQGNTTGFKYISGKFIADGAVGAGVNYTIGKMRMRLKKTGTPGWNLSVAIYTDAANQPGSLVGTGSSAVSATTLATSEGDIDFNTNATLTNGVTYWIVLSGDGAADAANYVEWAYNTTSNYYFYRSSAGVTWVNVGNNRRPKFKSFK